MWYSLGGFEELENTLEVLVDDGGAIEMLKIANTHGEVHLFLVHVVSDAEVMLVLGDGLEVEGVKADVEDGGGPEGFEHNVEYGGGVEPEGVEPNVEDGGGVDIGEHHGTKWVRKMMRRMRVLQLKARLGIDTEVKGGPIILLKV